jgi:putative flippase GtrA
MKHLINIAKYRFVKHRQFILYATIGVSSACMDYFLFLALFNIVHFNEVVANIISYTIGTTNSFVLNVAFNFKVRDKLFKRFVSFMSVGGLGLLVTSFVLWLFVDILSMNANWVKLFTIFLAVIIQYNLNKLISFRKHDK